ncbi:unnamed protein product [Rotaria socialis]
MRHVRRILRASVSVRSLLLAQGQRQLQLQLQQQVQPQPQPQLQPQRQAQRQAQLQLQRLPADEVFRNANENITFTNFQIDITSVNIAANAKWTQNGMTVAGGHGQGDAANQLYGPHGLSVDDGQTVVIADYGNHRIIQWKKGTTTNGQVVAGGNDQGSELNQSNWSRHVLIDKETDSLIICDSGKKRVVRWSRRSGTEQGEILIDKIGCYGLAMDDQAYLYVSSAQKHEARLYQLSEKNGILVAGGNGQGTSTNQLNNPHYLCVDPQQNVYVSDEGNNRVVKWSKGAKEDIVVAGGQGDGNAVTQSAYPNGLFVDALGTLYVAESKNDRVMRWVQGAKQGTLLVGGNSRGAEANQLDSPLGLSFDRQGNLYVAEYGNNRVQRFSIA